MNVVIAQSGGPTSVINASVLGVYRQALQWKGVQTVFGSLNGIEGILNDNLIALNDYIRTKEDMALLRQTPPRCCAPVVTSYPPMRNSLRYITRSGRRWNGMRLERFSTSAATTPWIRCINYRGTLRRWDAPSG